MRLPGGSAATPLSSGSAPPFAVYFRERRDGAIKVGKTSVGTENRAKGIDCGAGRTKLLATIGARSEQEMHELERSLHELFADARIDPEHEWFWPVAPLRAYISKLRPDVEPEPFEPALLWLTRVVEEGRYPSQAAHDRRSWAKVRNHTELNGGWSLWQILCGEKHGTYEPPLLRSHAHYVVRPKNVAITFHVWDEACRRRGINPPPGAIRACVRPRSYFQPWSPSRRSAYERRVWTPQDTFDHADQDECAEQVSLFGEVER